MRKILVSILIITAVIFSSCNESIDTSIDWRSYIIESNNLKDYLSQLSKLNLEPINSPPESPHGTKCFTTSNSNLKVCVVPFSDGWNVNLEYSKALKPEFRSFKNEISSSLTFIREDYSVIPQCNCLAALYRDRNKDVMLNIFESSQSYRQFNIILEYFRK